MSFLRRETNTQFQQCFFSESLYILLRDQAKIITSIFFVNKKLQVECYQTMLEWIITSMLGGS